MQESGQMKKREVLGHKPAPARSSEQNEKLVISPSLLQERIASAELHKLELQKKMNTLQPAYDEAAEVMEEAEYGIPNGLRAVEDDVARFIARSESLRAVLPDAQQRVFEGSRRPTLPKSQKERADLIETVFEAAFEDKSLWKDVTSLMQRYESAQAAVKQAEVQLMIEAQRIQPLEKALQHAQTEINHAQTQLYRMQDEERRAEKHAHQREQERPSIDALFTDEEMNLAYTGMDRLVKNQPLLDAERLTLQRLMLLRDADENIPSDFVHSIRQGIPVGRYTPGEFDLNLERYRDEIMGLDQQQAA